MLLLLVGAVKSKHEAESNDKAKAHTPQARQVADCITLGSDLPLGANKKAHHQRPHIIAYSVTILLSLESFYCRCAIA